MSNLSLKMKCNIFHFRTDTLNKPLKQSETLVKLRITNQLENQAGGQT